MGDITAKMIKSLRERTGVGMAKCKEALVSAKGDIEAAIANLRKAGIASAVKKESREANDGVISIFESDRAIAVVEINTETDFVAKNETFQTFAKEIAEEICSTAPESVEAFLKQTSKKDQEHTIDERRALLVQSLGENIQIKRFELFPKKSDHSLAVYSHGGGKLVTLVEIAGSGTLGNVAKDVAMHVASESPEYLSKEEVPPRVIEHEKEIAKAQVKGKPENIIDKIVEGKLKSYFGQACLLYQPFIKDSKMTIEKFVSSNDQGAHVTQFLRWRVGE
ncbi:MAG: Elongation factor Ts [Chlamydiales bacterium]|nr:Elongation factor Ts [Chlamydiales bacterium]MCH9619682.1 Elongation factor Ts [Chlamydiales bacterium]MCH9623288.1 Elongation factor Ts [Chlamydiales bacterium]